MLAVLPSNVVSLPERWRERIAQRRELAPVDPAADALERAATELEAEISRSQDMNRLVSGAEFARQHGVRPGTVRKWCARGLLAGAVKDISGDWRIPAGAVRARRRS